MTDEFSDPIDDATDDATDSEDLRARLQRQGEEALGKLAQDLLENPMINGALSRAFEAREKASQAQEVAMGALNIPSASDMERLTRRVRSVSQRLEGIEDGVDRLDERVGTLTAAISDADRLERIEEQLTTIHDELVALRQAPDDSEPPGHRAQERLKVGEHG